MCLDLYNQINQRFLNIRMEVVILPKKQQLKIALTVLTALLVLAETLYENLPTDVLECKDD